MSTLAIGTTGVLTGLALIVVGLVWDVLREKSAAVPPADQSDEAAREDWQRLVRAADGLSPDETETLGSVDPHQAADLIRDGRRRASFRRQLVEQVAASVITRR